MNSSPHRMLVFSFLAFFWVYGCESPPPDSTQDVPQSKPIVRDESHRPQWDGFSRLYISSSGDFRRYGAVEIDPISIAREKRSKLAVPTFQWMESDHGLSDGEAQLIEKYYREAFVQTLTAEGRFDLLDSTNSDVLRISGRIVDFGEISPAEESQRVQASSFFNQLDRMSLVLDVSDARTGKLLIQIRDDRALGDFQGFYSGDGTFRPTALPEIFGRWANRTFEQIEKVRLLPEIPSSSGNSEEWNHR